MIIKIDKESKIPVYLQIVDQIKEKIFKGTITVGYALPSERILAGKLGVHRNTVAKAYNELKAEGLVSSYQGKGYRIDIKKKAKAGDAEPDEKTEKRQKKSINWESLMRDEYAVFDSEFDAIYSKSFDSGVISFGGGVAAREPYTAEELADTFESIFKSDRKEAYFYAPYQGDPELRKEIVKFMATKGINVDMGNIQIFTENNQAIDFIMSLMLRPGDKVLIEETTSPDVFRTIRVAGGELLTIPMDENGIICDNLDAIIENEKPAFIYVGSSFNNPSGAILPLERRQKLLDISYKYRIPIIEEDEGSELYYDIEQVPSIKSMDMGNNVIYMYSLSLTMVPGAGISFVIADKNIIRRFGDMMSLRLSNPEWAAQMVTLEYMKRGIFAERLDEFRRVCREKRDLMCDLIDAFAGDYGLEYERPKGGVYLWIKLPSGINARRLLEQTQKLGMTFVPGHLFYPKKAHGGDHIRLNFSYPTKQQIRDGVAILEKALAHEKTK